MRYVYVTDDMMRQLLEMLRVYRVTGGDMVKGRFVADRPLVKDGVKVTEIEGIPVMFDPLCPPDTVYIFVPHVP